MKNTSAVPPKTPSVPPKGKTKTFNEKRAAMRGGKVKK